MRPLFNIPGSGAFPFLVSIISGYPVGAKLTSRIRENNDISKLEADRLISFSSTSGPLFILGAVLIGMLNSPQLSILMILPHYLGALTIGLTFKYYKYKNKEDTETYRHPINQIIQEKERASQKEKAIGALIGNSVKDGMETMLVIGGYLIIYSVIIDQVLSSKIFEYLISTVSSYLPVNSDAIEGVIAGFIELTTGCKKIALSSLSLINKIIIINFLIGWGGLSIHSQALSFITKTDINTKIYLGAKLLHGLFASIYAYLIYLIGFKDNVHTTTFIPPYTVEVFSLSDWSLRLVDSIKLAISVSIFYILFSIFIHQVLTEQ